MPPRREPEHKKTPLEQARLADLNFTFQTVNSRKQSTPARADKQKQVGLEAFGFISQPAKSSISTTELGGAAESEPAQRKRRKVVVKLPRISPSPSPSSRTCSLSPPAPFTQTPRHDDREVAETQFAQPGPQSEDESDPTTEERQSDPDVNLAPVSFPSPISVTLKAGPVQMFAPPVTPKRRKFLEIPSSHSPPVTPISPYKSPSKFSSSQRSPLSHRGSPLKSALKSASNWKKSGLVASSQWWDNEEAMLTQRFTQGQTQRRISPELSEDGSEDDDDFFNQTFHAGRLFQTDRARGSFSPLDETQAATYRTSLKIKAEKDPDTPHVSFSSDWEDSQRVETEVLESPHSGARKKAIAGSQRKIKTEPQEEEEEFPRCTQTQHRWENRHRYREDTVIPESPLGTPQKSRKEAHSEDRERTTITSTLPQSLSGTPADRKLPEETQYVVGTQIEYDWWDSLPATARGGAEGKRASNGEEIDDEEHQESKKLDKGKEKPGHEKIPESDDAMPTMSQLLPETLMESFPMPPPLTQWSSQPNWSPGQADDDEL